MSFESPRGHLQSCNLWWKEMTACVVASVWTQVHVADHSRLLWITVVILGSTPRPGWSMDYNKPDFLRLAPQQATRFISCDGRLDKKSTSGSKQERLRKRVWHMPHVIKSHEYGKMMLSFSVWVYTSTFYQISLTSLTLLVGWIPMLGVALFQVKLFEFPVLFTTPLTHASSHNASLCCVLHDSLSANLVPARPCSPHLQCTTPTSNLHFSLVCVVCLNWGYRTHWRW